MDLRHRIEIGDEVSASFCGAAYRVKRPALFGPDVGVRFTEQCDLNVPLEFEARRTPDLFGSASMEHELEPLGGRWVNFRPFDKLSHYMHASVAAEAGPSMQTNVQVESGPWWPWQRTTQRWLAAACTATLDADEMIRLAPTRSLVITYQDGGSNGATSGKAVDGHA